MRVRQHDRHPTTEQLSALLDGQLSSDERSQWDEHLKTCEQCQQELAELRLTVNLLRTLPQPELPRSFALPVNAPVTPIAAFSEHRAARGSAQRQRSRPVVLRTTANSLCAIAAVLGLFLLASALLASMHTMGTTTSMSAPAASSAQSSNASSGSARATSKIVPPTATHPQASAAPEITPTAPPTMGPYAVKPGSPQQSGHRAAAPLANALQSVLALFDVSTPGGRAALGLLLLLLGAIGFALLMTIGRPKERAP
jgi:hypothetical protein